MTKKNLSDLLQEEAQKFTPDQGESVIEVTAEKVVETNISSSAETGVQANLEFTIKELQETLKKSRHQVVSLQQEISELQTTLSEQKSLAESLTKELYETKKTALQLAESNSKMIEEINEIKKESSNKPVHEISKSLSINPKKSYRLPERLQEKPNQANDDFADKTWLYD
ncbi:hypothetical protein [Anabaena sp. UHCC 0451]|uniref:hypothetical protein n=1 Tax=Anabaena sp. UHCC 0451 TaxID=2055235 RepID=UPI002B1F3C6D|nr:hypothetical protein [Anabaena sp. UHCC 0451]MEA5575937.1 hypothetical protein [Anabaena sp. UHCC 0451]